MRLSQGIFILFLLALHSPSTAASAVVVCEDVPPAVVCRAVDTQREKLLERIAGLDPEELPGEVDLTDVEVPEPPRAPDVPDAPNVPPVADEVLDLVLGGPEGFCAFLPARGPAILDRAGDGGLGDAHVGELAEPAERVAEDASEPRALCAGLR